MKSLSVVCILEQADARGMGLAQFQRRFCQNLKDVSGGRRQHFGEFDQGGVFRFMVRFSRWTLVREVVRRTETSSVWPSSKRCCLFSLPRRNFAMHRSISPAF